MLNLKIKALSSPLDTRCGLFDNTGDRRLNLKPLNSVIMNVQTLDHSDSKSYSLPYQDI